MDLFQIFVNELPLKMRKYWYIFQVKSEGNINMKKSRKIVQKKLTLLSWSSENKMKHDSARCKVRHTAANKNFCCNLYAWKWQRRKKVWMFLGDTRCLSGTNMVKLWKRHMPWCDIAVLPVEQGNVDAVLLQLSPRRGLRFSYEASSISSAPFSE